MADTITVYFKNGVLNHYSVSGLPATLDLVFDSQVPSTDAFTKDGYVVDHVEISTSATVMDELPRIRCFPLGSPLEVHVADVTVKLGTERAIGKKVDAGSVNREGPATSGVVTLIYEPPGKGGDESFWTTSHKTPQLPLRVQVKRV